MIRYRLFGIAMLAGTAWGETVQTVPDLSGAAPVAIDGSFDEEVWVHAAEWRGMHRLGSTEPAGCDARLRAFYADGRLYLALEAEEPRPELLRMTVRPGAEADYPAAFTNDDLLELFLVQGERYACQLAFNPAGTLIFYGSRPSRLMYRDWRQPRLTEEWRLHCDYRVAVLADRWQVEMALDAADFEGFASGGWRFNLARERRAGGHEYSTLAPIPGDSFLLRRYYLPFAVDGVTAASAETGGTGGVLKPRRPADWIAEQTVVRQTPSGMALAGPGRIQSQETLNVDGGRCRISGEFRAAGPDGDVPFFFGLAMLDAGGRAILPQHILYVPGSETVLAEALADGATALLLADASHWRSGGDCFIAFDTAPDGSDLPNRNLSYAAGVTGVAANPDGTWTVTVPDGTRMARPAGARVREHFTGTSFWYVGGGALSAGRDWRTFAAEIAGFSLPGAIDAAHFWPGAGKVRLLLWVVDGDAAAQLEFRELQVSRL